MDRRESLKILALTTVSTGLLLDACKPADKKTDVKAAAPEQTIDRFAEEAANDKRLFSETFFTPHEMATITLLGDIIIPADDVSGSASDAKVPEFIEFIVKDKPENQVPMRGGLRWLDMQSTKRFGKPFKDAGKENQLTLVNEIAYPEKAKPGMKQGVAFFNRMRDLVATGFYTSEIGIKDLGYMGNRPNQWNGVPDDVLKKHNLAYTEKELKECISFT